MTQPVRKIIKEQHPELAEKPIYTLLVDGTNLLRISFADTRVNSRGEHYGGIFQFLLQIKKMLKKKDFDYVYVVFDDEESGILRYQYYHDYKANRDKNYGSMLTGNSDYIKHYNEVLKGMQNAIFSKSKPKKEKTPEEKLLDENFVRERNRLMEYFEELFIRCIFDSETEGDDIISYYVNNKKPNEKVVIMSTDEDITQLLSPTVCIYNTVKKTFYTYENFKSVKGYPSENVMIKKVFCGDTSDNIGKIDGLSENKLTEIMPEIKERPVTIQEVKDRAQKLIDERIADKKKPLKVCENIVNGVSRKDYDGDFYEINEKIINLKKPLLTDDAIETLKAYMYAPQDPDGRSIMNVAKLVEEDDILDLRDSNSFASFFSEYNALANREIQKFKKES